ncbi:DUF3987 domain-containing protein [Flavobacterium sp. WC2429]|uniref:DUF3987 domain-containing protein n=1 Tax=Flavobacterium sp. WC2429 TaxID=3234140 RepID=A0AB39WNL2_9FLAO
MDSNDTNPHGFNSLRKYSKINHFSYYPSAKAVVKQKDICVNEYLNLITDPAQKPKIESLRALPLDEYKKSKLLQPCITGSCLMDSLGRSKTNIQSLNGFVIVDLDILPTNYNSWDYLKADLILDPFTFIVHYSLSGRGLCIFVKVEKLNLFKEIYLSLSEYYLLNFGAKIDFLADETRLRFISYDAKPFYNPNSLEYTSTIAETKVAKTGTKEKDFDRLQFLTATPAEAFNNSGLAGLELINELLTELGFIITAGKTPTIYEYQRAGGSLKSIVAFFNSEVVKFQVFSPNTGLAKEHYNLFDLYKELTDLDDYKAQKELSLLGFGQFHESTKNVFPISALPDLFRAYAIDLKDSLNYPIDYTATAILTAVSTAIGTSAKLSVKKGWSEYASLYVALIGDAGANKTHPINTVFKPIRNKDKERHLDYVTAYEFYTSYEKLSKKDKESEEQIFCPKLEKSVVSNFTPEILNKRLEENPRGLCVLSDELATFFESMNNYSKGDQIGVYLSFWSNQATTIDRVGNAIPLFIAKPYLSMIGGLQPRVLNTAFPPNKLNNGFFQRFLFAYPDSSLKAPITDNEANSELANAYERYIENCFDNLTDNVLTFTAEAKQYFYKWQSDNCDKVNEHQNSIKGEILSKYDNHFLRLSLLLQMMHDPEAEAVELESVKGAEKLCEYYLNCAFKVLAKIHNTENYLSTMTPDKQALFNGLDDEFTTAEAVEVGEALKLKERAIKRFLSDAQLFKKVKHGIYKKVKSD